MLVLIFQPWASFEYLGDYNITIASGRVFAGNFVVKTVAVAAAEVVAWR